MKAGCSEELKNALFSALLCGQVFKLGLLSYCLHSRANLLLTPFSRQIGFTISIPVGSDQQVPVRTFVASDGSDTTTDATRRDAARSPLISAPSSSSQNRLNANQRLAAEVAARCKKVEVGCALGQMVQENSPVLDSLASSANLNPGLIQCAPVNVNGVAKARFEHNN